MPIREFYLNADFDRALLGGPSLLESGDATFVHEMAGHFLFAAGAGDSVILHRSLPADFKAYLDGKGLTLPRQVLHPEFTPEADFTPFGWDSHASSMAARYRRPAVHPDLDAVKRANSRAFSLSLEREWGQPHGVLHDTLEGLEAFIAGSGDAAAGEGWVVKGNHGHAGTANRRIPSGPLSPENRVSLARLLEEHGCAAAEPWHERILDMSVSFEADPEGGLSGFRGHELLNSRDGAFLGVKILPHGGPPEPWAETLHAYASRLADALRAIGYHGPVSMDAYVWKSADGPRLRPLVDVNARRSMALPAHGLARRLPGRTLLWTWSKPRKLRLPASYGELDDRLGELRFRRETGTGILAVSPLRLDPAPGVHGDAGRPKRVGFLLSAEDEAGLARLRTGFAEALGRG